MTKRKRETPNDTTSNRSELTSSFAESQLLKFGWRKGTGLGRNGRGIAKAIKVGHKQDTFGLGKDADQWTVQWWDHVYNKTSASLDIGKSSNGKVLIASKQLTREAKREAELSLLYRNFVPARETRFDPSNLLLAGDDEENEKYRTKLTDRELFEACGGRTAAKGARAAVVGKLSRVDPEKLLAAVDDQENTDNSSSEDEFEVRAREIAEEMSGQRSDVKRKRIEAVTSTPSPTTSATDQVIPERWARRHVLTTGEGKAGENGSDHVERRRKAKTGKRKSRDVIEEKSEHEDATPSSEAARDRGAESREVHRKRRKEKRRKGEDESVLVEI